MDFEVKDHDDKTCIICEDIGKDNELWFQCFSCKLWAHAECTELSSRKKLNLKNGIVIAAIFN